MTTTETRDTKTGDAACLQILGQAQEVGKGIMGVGLKPWAKLTLHSPRKRLLAGIWLWGQCQVRGAGIGSNLWGKERAHCPERERERWKQETQTCDGESKDKTRESCSPANTESTVVSVPRKSLQPLPHHQDYQHVLRARLFQHAKE